MLRRSEEWQNLAQSMRIFLSALSPVFTTTIDELAKAKNLNAANIVRELAKEINGGGGGQPFYAQAGGSDLKGLASALEKATKLI